MERTMHISDRELRSTLDEFLNEKEKKKPESIWNFSTITGIALVITAAAYIGNQLGSAFFGLNALPFLSTLSYLAPIFGGSLLLLILISAFIKNKKQKKITAEEQVRIRQTYDKLDEFLYDKDDFQGRTDKNRASDDFNVIQKLMKSRTDKKISGVCGGLAKYLGVSSTLVRVIFAGATLLGYGVLIFVYIAMAFVMPKEPISEMDDFRF